MEHALFNTLCACAGMLILAVVAVRWVWNQF